MTKTEKRKAYEAGQKRKYAKVEWYTNYYLWCGRLKKVEEFKKFQMMLNDLVVSNELKPKEKAEIFAFIYPMFCKRLEEIKSKSKTFNFTINPIFTMIWC